MDTRSAAAADSAARCLDRWGTPSPARRPCGDGGDVTAELVGEIEDALGLARGLAYLVANEARVCFTDGGGGVEKLRDRDSDLADVAVAEERRERRRMWRTTAGNASIEM